MLSREMEMQSPADKGWQERQVSIAWRTHRLDEGEVRENTLSQNEYVYFSIHFHHVNWPHLFPFVQ